MQSGGAERVIAVVATASGTDQDEAVGDGGGTIPRNAAAEKNARTTLAMVYRIEQGGLDDTSSDEDDGK